MWTCPAISGRMSPSTADHGSVRPGRTWLAEKSSSVTVYGQWMCLAGIKGTNHMAEREESESQAGELPEFGLIINSDAWEKSLPVTAWDALKDADRDSVEYFARRYATPIYCYFRRHNIQRDQAKDLTQGFLVDKIILGRLLSRYSPGEHRFRSYLLPALRNYQIDFIRKRNREPTLGLDQVMEGSPDLEPAVEKDVEREVICQCVHDQLREVMLLVQCECKQDGLGDHFLMFCLRHLTNPRPSWKKIGEEFGIDWQEAKNRAWTVRDRLKKAILKEFRMQGMTKDEVLDEIRELKGMFHNFFGTELSFEERENE